MQRKFLAILLCVAMLATMFTGLLSVSADSTADENTSIGRIYFPFGEIASFAAVRTSRSKEVACLSKYDLNAFNSDFNPSATSENWFINVRSNFSTNVHTFEKLNFSQLKNVKFKIFSKNCKIYLSDGDQNI
jgi:hypothetical protein